MKPLRGWIIPEDDARAMLLPLGPGHCPEFTFYADASADTELCFHLRTTERPDNFTPDVSLASVRVPLPAGLNRKVVARFPVTLDQTRYCFVCIDPDAVARLHLSDFRMTGVLSLNRSERYGRQEPPDGSGFDAFEFWVPHRRPGGKNLAMDVAPPLVPFFAASLTNGVNRPTSSPNAWVAALEDHKPTLTLRWPEPVSITSVVLCFDTDFDHPLESVLMTHPEEVSPFCVRRVTIKNEAGHVLAEIQENHLSQRTIRLNEPCRTRQLTLELSHPESGSPAALFGVRCYGDEKAE